MIELISAIPKGEFKIINVLEKIDGVNHRRTITPDKDVSDQPEEVQAVCNDAWTPEIIEAYNTHLLESVI